MIGRRVSREVVSDLLKGLGALLLLAGLTVGAAESARADTGDPGGEFGPDAVRCSDWDPESPGACDCTYPGVDNPNPRIGEYCGKETGYTGSYWCDYWNCRCWRSNGLPESPTVCTKPAG